MGGRGERGWCLAQLCGLLGMLKTSKQNLGSRFVMPRSFDAFLPTLRHLLVCLKTYIKKKQVSYSFFIPMYSDLPYFSYILFYILSV